MEAELGSCMEGLSLAIQWSDLSVLLEVDLASVVNILKDEDVDWSALASLVAETKYFFSPVEPILFMSSIDKTFVLFFLANSVRTKNRIVVWLGSWRPEAVDLCKVDCNMAGDWVIQVFTRKKKEW